MIGESEQRVIVVQEVPPVNLFLYTTAGLAIIIAAMAVYFIRFKKPKPK